MAEEGFFNIKDMTQGLRRELSNGISTRIFFWRERHVVRGRGSGERQSNHP